MKRRRRLTAMIAALVVAAGCGYPTFQFGPSGAGGGTASSTSSTTSASSSSSSATSSSGTTSTSSTSTSSTTTSSSGAPCALDHVVISQIRSRGPGGAADEFVELWNPTSSDILLDESWTVDGRAASLTSVVYENRWTGYSGDTIPAHGHFLIVGASYTQSPLPDDVLSEAIGDAESLVLNLGGAEVDAVCYYYSATQLGELNDLGYTCAGMPVVNPHDDASDTNTDASLERKPGGAAGNCVDSGDNSLDFVILTPSAPEDAASAPAPG